MSKQMSKRAASIRSAKLEIASPPSTPTTKTRKSPAKMTKTAISDSQMNEIAAAVPKSKKKPALVSEENPASVLSLTSPTKTRKTKSKLAETPSIKVQPIITMPETEIVPKKRQTRSKKATTTAMTDAPLSLPEATTIPQATSSTQSSRATQQQVPVAQQFQMPLYTQTNGTQYLTFAPNSTDHWRQWLATHHNTHKAVWLLYYTKASKIPSIDYSDAVDQALCFGWIDSTRKSMKNLEFEEDPEGDRLRLEGKDECRYIQLFTPRNSKTSGWSRVNKDKVERLIAADLMHAAGLEVIDVAKSNGLWTSLDDLENLVVPDDLEEAFQATAANRAKYEKFNLLSRSKKRMLLYHLVHAKRAETRIKRISDILDDL